MLGVLGSQAPDVLWVSSRPSAGIVLVGATGGAQAIFEVIGGPAQPLQPHPLAPMPMLHVPIGFESSPERESIPYSLYWLPNHCSIIQPCTYMFLAAVGTLYFLFQTLYLLRNILKWDIALITLSHLVRVIVPVGAIDAVSLNFYWYLVSYSKWLRNFTVEYFCMKNNLDYINIMIFNSHKTSASLCGSNFKIHCCNRKFWLHAYTITGRK